MEQINDVPGIRQRHRPRKRLTSRRAGDVRETVVGAALNQFAVHPMPEHRAVDLADDSMNFAGLDDYR